jgi:hypothetical protein
VVITKKSIQEINFTFEQDRKSKFVSHKKGMCTIRCACGFEILVLPDVKAMDRAVENHVAEHRVASGCSESNLALGWLRQFLTAQLLRVASEINLPIVN